MNTKPGGGLKLHLRSYAIIRHMFLAIISSLISINVYSQAVNCTGGTVSFPVNLTGQPNGTYISPPAYRGGSCCTSGQTNCIEFVITLDSAAVGINFSVASGADPGGALYYQVNCGPVIATGTPICLSGTGPHIITFCKPGGNVNTYQITSIAGPEASDPIIVNDGCTGVLSMTGLEPSTVTWNSVFPGATGSYNSYLSCSTGCTSTVVTGQPSAPAYVDYQVCGTAIGNCASLSLL